MLVAAHRTIACTLLAAVLLAGGCGDDGADPTPRSSAPQAPSDTVPTMQQIERWAREGDTVRAIKGYRALHGVGLKDAAEAVERLKRGR